MENTKFKSMFVVEPFTDKKGIGNFDNEKQHPFNITNMMVENDGILIDVEEYRYFDEVSHKVFGVFDSSEIKQFLSYHFFHAKDKQTFLDYFKYDVWHGFARNLVPVPELKKKVILDWIKKNKKKYKAKSKSINKLIKDTFPNIIDAEIEIVKNNLRGQNQIVHLTYVGTKLSLYKKLGYIRDAGYDSKLVAYLIIEHCIYRRSPNSQPETFELERLIKDIGK